jgi:hypothetical protein
MAASTWFGVWRQEHVAIYGLIVSLLNNFCSFGTALVIASHEYLIISMVTKSTLEKVHLSSTYQITVIKLIKYHPERESIMNKSGFMQRGQGICPDDR